MKGTKKQQQKIHQIYFLNSKFSENVNTASLEALFRCNGFACRTLLFANVYTGNYCVKNDILRKNSSFNVDKIKIRRVKPKDSERVLEFLRIHYYKEEPLTIGIQPVEQTKENEEYDIATIAEGFSLMALHSSCRIRGCGPDERIVGVVLAGSKKCDESKHLFEEAAKFGPTKDGHILQFLACVERDANVYERYNVDKALHADLLSVDANVRGKKLGTRLMLALAKLGRRKRYPLLTIDCTSYYSAQLIANLGWDCVNVMYYVDYVDDDEEPVFQPPPPHFCCKTYAVALHKREKKI